MDKKTGINDKNSDNKSLEQSRRELLEMKRELEEKKRLLEQRLNSAKEPVDNEEKVTKRVKTVSSQDRPKLIVKKAVDNRFDEKRKTDSVRVKSPLIKTKDKEEVSRPKLIIKNKLIKEEPIANDDIFEAIDIKVTNSNRVYKKNNEEKKETSTSDVKIKKVTKARPKIEGEYASRIKQDDQHVKPMLKHKTEDVPAYNAKKHKTQVEEKEVKEEVKEVKVKSFVEPEVKKNNGRYGKIKLPKFDKDTERTRIFRHELKYYINEADYAMLSNSLNCLLKHDENAGVDGDYYIRSLYFDDYMNSALVDKLAGIENRKKYRVRIYGLKDDFIRLERKNKTKDFISKDNLTLSRQEYDNVINGDIEFLLKKKNQLAKDFYYEIKTKKLKPAVIVDYVREAYVHPIKNLRITFDKMVKSGRYDTSIFSKEVALAPVLPPGTVVLEVKFEKGLPDYIIGVLNTISCCQRSAISKYALCRKYEG